MRRVSATRSSSVMRNASAIATMPATLCVPLRRSRSCPPPCSNGLKTVPSLATNTPTPFGPPNLCADNASRSTCGVIVRRSIQVGACTASECTTARRREPADERRRLGDRIDRADLVVDGHHRDNADGGLGRQHFAKLVEIDPARGVDADDAAAAVLDAVQHRVVFGRGADSDTAVALQCAGDGRIVALGTATGEDHLAGRTTDHLGDDVTGLIDRLARRTGQTGESHSGWRNAR